MRTLYENLVDEVDYRADENVTEWTMAQFKGKDKAIDLGLEKNGALILTDQRVIFKGGVVLGHGFQDEISIPLSQVQDVSSERKLFKDEYRKLLVLRWQSPEGEDSAVFYPTDSKTGSEGVMKSISSLKPGEKALAERWKDKIESNISSIPKDQTSTPNSKDSQDIPPPPPNHQEEQKTSSKSSTEQQPDTSTFSCPNCGEETQQDMNFCPYCGSELELVCDDCGMELEEDWNFCPNCKNEI